MNTTSDKSAKPSRWFGIDKYGQPTLPGWYETRYWRTDHDLDRLYWDGANWRFGPDDDVTAFGNWDTQGESWRGLASDPSKAG